MPKYFYSILIFTILCTNIVNGQTSMAAIDSLTSCIKKIENDSMKIYSILTFIDENKHLDTATAVNLFLVAEKISLAKRNLKLQFYTLYKLAYYYQTKGDYSNSFVYFIKCDSIAAISKNEKELCASRNALARAYEQIHDYKNALLYYNENLNQNFDYDRKIGSSAQIGNIYNRIGDFPSALKYFNISYSLLEKAITGKPSNVDDTLQLIGLLISMGNLHVIMQQHPDAKAMYFNAFELAEKVNSPDLAFIAKNGIGETLIKENKYSESISFLTNILRTYQNLIAHRDLRNGWSSLANAYFLNNEPDKALETALQALDTTRDENNAKVNLLIGKIYLQKKELQKSKRYIEQALVLVKENNSITVSVDVYQALAELYDALHQAAPALEAFKTYMMLRDSIYSTEKANALITLDLRQDFSRKQITDSLRQASVYGLKMQKQRWVANSGLVGLLLVALLSFFIYRSYQSEKKYNTLLAKEQKRQQEVIQHQGDVLSDISYTQSHHIRGPVSTLLGLTSILNTDDPTDPHNQQILADIVEVSQRIDAVVTDIVKKENAVSLKKEP